jgi:2-polyprenyl-3-methyl-5-hydroxy-6-metoxy-1,4-benzoquinol methylase
MADPDLMTYAGAVDWLGAEYPILAAGLRRLETVPDAPLARAVYELFLTKVQRDRTSIKAGLESFAAMSFDFLRLQARFQQTGRYEASSEEELLRTLYSDEQRMDGEYLDALLLSYCFWPNHIALLSFFEARFLARLKEGDRILEVGVGHGLMALLAMQAFPACEYTGFDLSSGAKRYSERLWQNAKADFSKARVSVSSLTAGLAETPDQAPWDCAICCEVLEHVARPDALLHELQTALKPEGLAFVTSVANIAAQDHIYRFADAEHLRTTIRDCGFAIEEELALPLRGSDAVERRPLNYAAILRRR